MNRSEPTPAQALSPEEFTAQVRAALPQSCPDEQARLIKHANAWATVHYNGEIPAPLLQELNLLEGYRRGQIR